VKLDATAPSKSAENPHRHPQLPKSSELPPPEMWTHLEHQWRTQKHSGRSVLLRLPDSVEISARLAYSGTMPANESNSEWLNRKKRIDPLLTSLGWPKKNKQSTGSYRLEEYETAGGAAKRSHEAKVERDRKRNQDKQNKEE
jgi:hypothetical protein